MTADENILKEITHVLKTAPGFDATHVEVAVENGTVVLTGSVHSSIAIWMVKEAVKHIKGIKNIKEKLKVIPSKES